MEQFYLNSLLFPVKNLSISRYLLTGFCLMICTAMLSQEQFVQRKEINNHLIGDDDGPFDALNLGDRSYEMTTWLGPINHKISQQDALISHGEYQYTTYYNEDRYVCVARRLSGTQQWKEIVLDDYRQQTNDAHNFISMGICRNDGTIHLSFDHHGDDLNYRRSIPNAVNDPDLSWDKALFEDVRDFLMDGQPTIEAITYPQFIATPSGDLQMYYRIGRGADGKNGRLIDYSRTKGWHDDRMVISSKGTYVLGDETFTDERAAYVNEITYDQNERLHLTWTFKEKFGPGYGARTNHDLYYAYSDDGGRKWINNNNDTISDSRNGTAINIDSEGILAVPIGHGIGLVSTGGMVVDSQGRIHVLLNFSKVNPEDRNHYRHYWRRANGEWQPENVLNFNGSQARLYADKNDNILMMQSVVGTMRVRVASPTNNYASWEFLANEGVDLEGTPAVDRVLWKEQGILSMSLQKRADTYEPTPIQMFDIEFDYPGEPPTAANDVSGDHQRNQMAWVDFLDNDRLGDGSEITGLSGVTVDLRPWVTDIQPVREVAGEGVWRVLEDDGKWKIRFNPRENFIGDPSPIHYRIQEETTKKWSNAAQVTVRYAGNSSPPIAENDESLENEVGEFVGIAILSNDTLGNGSVPNSTEQVDIDLKPWTPKVDDERRVVGEGLWQVETVYGNWALKFTPDSGFRGTAKKITYRLIEKDTGLSDKANVIVSYSRDSNDKGIVIYPNPVTDELTLSSEAGEKIEGYMIYGPAGNMVKGKLDLDSNTVKIKFGENPPGVYVLDIYTDGRKVAKKIIMN